MIAWWVGLILFFAGDIMGILATAICIGGQEDEKKRNKKNRQRCNTGGSVERSSRE